MLHRASRKTLASSTRRVVLALMIAALCGTVGLAARAEDLVRIGLPTSAQGPLRMKVASIRPPRAATLGSRSRSTTMSLTRPSHATP